MARKGRKGRKQKQSKGLLYLIILICIVCICYEPIAGALHINLPAAVTELSEKTPVKATSTEAISVKNVLYPAPLKNTPEQILYRKGYTVSYNKETKIPNWVAWELTPEKLIERESRTDKFMPDLLGGVAEITAETPAGPLHLIPYYAWDNRETGRMKVWIDEK